MPSDQTPRRDYVASDLKVISFDRHVRQRPAMYFGCAADDPDLPTAILAAVIADAVYERDGQDVQVEVLIESDLTFTVTVTSTFRSLDANGRPGLGFAGTLIDRRRWPLAPAAALSSYSIFEVTVGGQRWSQELAGLTPITEVRHLGATKEHLNRATFCLDAGFFARSLALPSCVTALKRHWDRGERVVDTTRLTFRDERTQARS